MTKFGTFSRLHLQQGYVSSAVEAGRPRSPGDDIATFPNRTSEGKVAVFPTSQKERKHQHAKWLAGITMYVRIGKARMGYAPFLFFSI